MILFLPLAACFILVSGSESLNVKQGKSIEIQKKENIEKTLTSILGESEQGDKEKETEATSIILSVLLEFGDLGIQTLSTEKRKDKREDDDHEKEKTKSHRFESKTHEPSTLAMDLDILMKTPEKPKSRPKSGSRAPHPAPMKRKNREQDKETGGRKVNKGEKTLPKS